MLLEFKVGNYKSIKEMQTFSMLRSSRENSLKDNYSTINIKKIGDSSKCIDVLKTSAIYGANASGKSNLIHSMFVLQTLIINSYKNQQGTLLPVVPYRLNDIYKDLPTYFEVIFIENSTKYRYLLRLTQCKIIEECLYCYPNGRETKVFTRKDNEIKINFNISKTLDEKDKVRQQIYAEDIANNILFLSLANRIKLEEVKSAFNWFATKLVVIPDHRHLVSTTTPMLSYNDIDSSTVLKYLKMADPLISNINIETIEPKDNNDPRFSRIKQDFITKMKESNPSINIDELFVDNNLAILREKFYRYGSDKDGKIKNIEFTLNEESRGTQKFYSLIGPLFNSLKKGHVLVCDEFETSLHPLLMQGIIEIFTSIENNSNAQLIISTHDVNLLDKNNLFRKDQIWFVEKNYLGESEVYSVSDFNKTSRKDLSSKSYLKGKFGAIPEVDVWELINDMQERIS